MPDDHQETEFQAHFFEGPFWDDDPEEVEPDDDATSVDGDDDEVEGHASGFG
jgi:hypothetical protein